MITLDDLAYILRGAANVTINVTVTINGPVQIVSLDATAEADPLPLAAPRYSIAPPDADFEERYQQMQRNRAAWIDAEFARLVPPGVT